MNRKDIIAAGVGAELFYSSATIYGETYRAVVESVEPKTTRYGARNRGVEVTLWDEDADMKRWHGDEWRKDAKTGMSYKRTIVDAGKLKGPWKEWRAEQLAQRERDAQRQAQKRAAEDRAIRAAILINEAIGDELRAKLGDAMRTAGAGVYSVSMRPDLARELLAGWQWARAQYGAEAWDAERRTKEPGDDDA